MAFQNILPKRVLVIEDSDSKWKDIDHLLRSLGQTNMTLARATTVVDAETEVSKGDWDLLVLDISMDITASSDGPKSGGHDILGGLHIANKMFLLGHMAPTIIVTAFDAFPSGETNHGRGEILGLEDIKVRAASLLGTSFRGCIRYGDASWDENFLRLTKEVILE